MNININIGTKSRSLQTISNSRITLDSLVNRQSQSQVIFRSKSGLLKLFTSSLHLLLLMVLVVVVIIVRLVLVFGDRSDLGDIHVVAIVVFAVAIPGVLILGIVSGDNRVSRSSTIAVPVRAAGPARVITRAIILALIVVASVMAVVVVIVAVPVVERPKTGQ